MPFFNHVALAPPDPILGLSAAFHADQREKKINLGVGYYKDELLQTPILRCVKQAEQFLLQNEKNKEYLSIDGDRTLVDKIGELVFGKIFWSKEVSRIAGFQTVGGTGALKIAGTFCKEEHSYRLCMPSPTWPNHVGVFSGCQLPIAHYPYYDSKAHKLEKENWFSFLEQLESGSIVLLHASCHNPTGCDPSFEEWQELLSIMTRKKLIPFFDFAYQGFGEGISEDAQAVRLFAENCNEMFIAFSAAKNFSVYGERVGVLYILAESAKTATHISSRVKQMIRTNYSNPPKHGAAVISHILSEPQLTSLWEQEVEKMRTRIHLLRRELSDRLIAKNACFAHLKKRHGMFCFTGLQEQQVAYLIKNYGIYMPYDGRINVCGLNKKNMDYVVDAISSLF